MKRKGSKPPKERKKQPHEVLSLMAAWHSAVSSFLDSRACLVPGDEMFVLLEEASAACALGMLSVGFSRYACTPRLHAEELPQKILISIKGERRFAGAPLPLRSLLPQKESHRAALGCFLSQNAMTYELQCTEKELVLTVSIPRFLVNENDVAAPVDVDDFCDRFYDVMLYLAGEAPEEPLPLSPVE